MPPPPLDEFQIGWICALPIETAAAQQMLDETFEPLEEQDARDTNSYTLGRIGKHYVVIACLGQYGTTSATIVANNMMRTFSNSLRIGLMVGIGGGIPSAINDIRLGDIVISSPTGTCGGVVQYDIGKVLDGHFTRTGSLNSPPRVLLGAVNMMRANMLGNDPLYPRFIAEVTRKNARTRRNFSRPETQHDLLFKTEYSHLPNEDSCEKCSQEWKLSRDPREDNEPQPHYGIIASGNSVIKNALIREQIHQDTGALCFEMEAAGLMQDFPCIVIRGICDYADSHKNKRFQGFAALAAASYTKELLQYVPRGQLSGEKLIADISGIKDSLNTLESLNEKTCQTIDSLRQEIDLSKLPIASDAMFGTYANRYEPECLPGTRVDTRHKVTEWAASAKGKCIFWLNGMAGTGKSTISRTVARSFKEKAMLGASFFFKRGEGERGNATRFVSTITTQLLSAIPELIPFVRKVIDKDAGIAHKTLQDQFEQLLLQPLVELQKCTQRSPLIIVIDALDECDEDNDIRHILRFLPQLQESSSIHLRIFLTSRPELPIRLGFKEIAEDHEFLVLHEIEKTDIEFDISLFLEHRLGEIRKDRSLPLHWPGSTKIHTLATMSVPLFIFAATICRILEDPQWDPEDSLSEILAYQTEDSRLGAVYLPILNQLCTGQHGKRKEKLINEYKQVVGSIIMLESPLSAKALSKLLGISQRLVNIRLDSLHSVLHVPGDDTAPVKLLHLSFRDFLLDKSTREKTPLWIDGEDLHAKLTNQCIELLLRHLARNVCNLPSYGSERKDISAQTISQNLPPEVQYACRYWAQHLVQSGHPSVEIKIAFPFLESHFYHWIEAMSILGFATEVVRIISILQSVVPDTKDRRISDFLYDSKRFMLKNAYILDIAPLQLYSSGLIFAPQSAIIREKVKKLPGWMNGLPQVEEYWNADFQTLEGHSDEVLSIAFSPDGRFLASASSDTTIKIWDFKMGALNKTINGHCKRVTSVLFTPDDQFLISGSIDGTIKFWNIATGTLHRTLQITAGDIDSMSAAISPDGELLATASEGINLWNIKTGSLHRTPRDEWILADNLAPFTNLPIRKIFIPETQTPAYEAVSISRDGLISRSNPISSENFSYWYLQNHIKNTRSIAFSPNGLILASGSRDSSICLWNVYAGVRDKLLTGHRDHVDSVAFSPDSQLLASGSLDGTIKLWDTSTGIIQRTFDKSFRGIRSVAFSPDGNFMASGFTDNTVTLWSLSSENIQETLKGHGDWVYTVAFSPDGQLLASASGDKTIKLWDIDVKPSQQDSRHLEYIQSVEFSPDGKLLASVSVDSIVKLWNTADGSLKHTFTAPLSQPNDLYPYSSWATRVAKFGFVKFSPNGQMLGSGPGDQCIDLWNIATTSLQRTLYDRSGRILCIAFSPDGRFLLSGSTNATTKLWSIATGTIHKVIEHNHWVESVAFSPDGSLITSRSKDITRISSLWDCEPRPRDRIIESTRNSASQNRDIEDRGSMTYSPNGRILAVGDHSLELWDVFGEITQTLGDSGVLAMAFSPDSKYLASSSRGETVKLWEIVTGRLLHTFNIQGVATNLAFSGDGSQLFTNLGSLNISSWCGTDGSLNTTDSNMAVFIQANQWITINGENAVWLPPEYRPICSTFKNGILALGHDSGRVSIMRFAYNQVDAIISSTHRITLKSQYLLR